MTISITHHGMDLTQAIRDYVEEKILSLEKYSDEIRHVDVNVGLASHQNSGKIYECRAVLQVEGDVMKIEKTADDLYKSIDKVKDHLRVELADWKKKREDERKV